MTRVLLTAVLLLLPLAHSGEKTTSQTQKKSVLESECFGDCSLASDRTEYSATQEEGAVISRVCVTSGSELRGLHLTFADGSSSDWIGDEVMDDSTMNCTSSLPSGECFTSVSIGMRNTKLVGLRLVSSSNVDSGLLGASLGTAIGESAETISTNDLCLTAISVGLGMSIGGISGAPQNDTVLSQLLFQFSGDVNNNNQEYDTRHLFDTHVYDVGNGIMVATLIGAFCTFFICGVIGCIKKGRFRSTDDTIEREKFVPEKGEIELKTSATTTPGVVDHDNHDDDDDDDDDHHHHQQASNLQVKRQRLHTKSMDGDDNDNAGNRNNVVEEEAVEVVTPKEEAPQVEPVMSASSVEQPQSQPQPQPQLSETDAGLKPMSSAEILDGVDQRDDDDVP